MTADLDQKKSKLKNSSFIPVAVFIILMFTLTLSGCSGDREDVEGSGQKDRLPLAGSKIIVMAASDLTGAFEEIGRDFKKETGVETIFAFGSSGQLSEGILNGGRADVFASASGKYVDPLIKKGLADEKSRTVYALGKIVIMTRSNEKFQPTTLTELNDPVIKKVVIANPDHAPYGFAAKQAFEHEDMWGAIKPKIVLAENAKQTLTFVETGNAEAGIVALSLVINSKAEWADIPADFYDPIEQTIVLIKSSRNKAAADAFLRYVSGPKGKSILKKYGFDMPTKQ